MAVTLKDIAQEAGTTVMTVSNVINGRYGKVSQATVDKVRAIAEKLDYVPSATARSLVARSSRLVGVLLPDSEGSNVLVSPHNVAVIGVIERMLQENGYYVLLRSIPSADPGSVTAALRSWNLDGAVFIGFLDSQIRTMRASLDTALVVLDSYEKNSEVMNVRLNDRKGGYLATRHLIEKGHTRIAFVGPTITGALITAGWGHPWGFYFFAVVAVLAVFAVLTLPQRATSSAVQHEPSRPRQDTP